MTMPGPLNTSWANSQIVNASDMNSVASTVNALETLCAPLLTVTTIPTATSVAEWDANKNFSANNLQTGLTSIPTSGGTTTLTIASAGIIVFTGTQNQTCVLATTGVPAGLDTLIINQSTGIITINASGGQTVLTLGPLTTGIAASALFTALQAAPTLALHWNAQHIGIDIASGKILHVSNTLTLAGTDGTTFTLSPTSSLVDGELFCTLTAAYTLANSTGAQALFNTSVNGAVTLLSGSYFFECLFSLTGLSASSGSFGFGFGGTAVITAQQWWAEANKAALATPAAPVVSINTATNTTLVAANTNTTGFAKIAGKLRIGTGGTLIPQVQTSVGVGTAIVGVDSYFRIWNVGASNVTTFGTWT